MKNKFLLILVSIALCLSLAACGVVEDPIETTPAETTESPKPETTLAPETTKAPEITPAPETTKAPETTEAPETTASPETSVPLETTLSYPETPVVTPGVAIETTPGGKETDPEPSYVRPSGSQRRGSVLYEIIDAQHERLQNVPIIPSAGVTLRYYGEYGNSDSINVYVMFIDTPGLAYTEMVWHETLGDQTFTYYNGQQLDVYIRDAENSKLCTLKEAYEEGFIEDTQLAALNARYMTGKPTIIKEDNPVLAAVTEDLIAAYFDNNRNAKATLRNCGCYNGAYVVYIDITNRPYLDAMYYVQIGDHIIEYRSSQTMEVYHEGSFYSLEDAFEAGILTNDDIAEISEINSAQLFVVTFN